jgi:hypothetical protein
VADAVQHLGPVLYYNTIMFEAAGLTDDDVPTTLDELRDTSQAIVDSGVAPFGFALEVSPWYVEQWFAMGNQALVDNDNGRTNRATSSQPRFVDRQLEIFTFVDGMVRRRARHQHRRNTSGVDALLAIANEDVAMTFGTSAALGSILAVLESGQFPNVGSRRGSAARPERWRRARRWSGHLAGRARPDRSREGRRVGLPALAERARAAGRVACGHRVHADPPGGDRVPRCSSCGPTSPRSGSPTTSSWPRRPTSAARSSATTPALRDAIVEALERMILQGTSPEVVLAEAKQQADAVITAYNRSVDR